MDNFKSDIHNEVMREYEIIRSKNEAIHKNNKEQIYIHIPRIKEIDEMLSKVSLKACKLLLENSANHEKIIEDLRVKTESLSKEKAKLLTDAGMPEDFMNEIYTCTKCMDKGVVDNKWCKCYYDKVQKVMQKRSNICADKMHSFDKFNIKLYSNVPDSEFDNATPRENAKSIYETAVKYAKLDDSVSRQMLFYGSTGLGKTFTSDCIAKEFIKNGKDVYYTSAPRLFSIFEDYKFGRNTTAEAKRIIDYISEVDLLIIDDLGTEFRTQYIDSILFDIINTRINEKKYMIISTNLTPSQLETTYSQRISSRILGNFETIPFFGNDLRIKS